ncbi:MAG TPA: hypothetical protein VFO67_17785 [Gemmatimonadales bacterium]|nr:hypothetical protein [Gemmatimonadales bacterium]
MTADKRRTVRRPASAARGSGVAGKVVVQNINHPGTHRFVDAAKYGAMRRAILQVLPSRAPGLTLADALTAALPHLPTSLFPGGAHVGWWFKTVQLDLEVNRAIAREKTIPLRVHRL